MTPCRTSRTSFSGQLRASRLQLLWPRLLHFMLHRTTTRAMYVLLRLFFLVFLRLQKKTFFLFYFFIALVAMRTAFIRRGTSLLAPVCASWRSWLPLPSVLQHFLAKHRAQLRQSAQASPFTTFCMAARCPGQKRCEPLWTFLRTRPASAASLPRPCPCGAQRLCIGAWRLFLQPTARPISTAAGATATRHWPHLCLRRPLLCRRRRRQRLLRRRQLKTRHLKPPHWRLLVCSVVVLVLCRVSFAVPLFFKKKTNVLAFFCRPA